MSNSPIAQDELGVAHELGVAQGLAWIDAVGIGLVVLLFALGFWRGLWWQVMRLVGVFGAVLLARALSPRWEPLVLERFSELSPRFAQGLLWILLFLAGLAVAALLGLIGKRMLDALQLSLVDRTGGAFAGAATGLIGHCALLAALVQLGPEDFVLRTVAGTWSENLLATVGQRFPVVVDAAEGSEIDRLMQWSPRLGLDGASPGEANAGGASAVEASADGAAPPPAPVAPHGIVR